MSTRKEVGNQKELGTRGADGELIGFRLPIPYLLTLVRCCVTDVENLDSISGSATDFCCSVSHWSVFKILARNVRESMCPSLVASFIEGS